MTATTTSIQARSASKGIRAACAPRAKQNLDSHRFHSSFSSVYDGGMSTAPRYQPHYTVDDYAHWEGQWELWNGVAVAMSPSPFGRHAKLLARTVAALQTAIDSAGCHATVLVEIDWIVSSDTVLRPDVIVVCGLEPEQHVVKVPALVVEILSEATRDRDLSFKLDLYREQGVRWYLVVDPERRLPFLRRCGETVCLSEKGSYLFFTFLKEGCLPPKHGKLFLGYPASYACYGSASRASVGGGWVDRGAPARQSSAVSTSYEIRDRDGLRQVVSRCSARHSE